MNMAIKKYKMQISNFPKRIELELSSTCNLKCTYCPRKFVKDLNGFMDLVLFRGLVDEAAAYPETILVLHRRGESLLHPNFIEMMDYIQGRFETVQLATNATQLTGENAKAIIGAVTFLSFSIDTPHLYDTTRQPARYEDVKENILTFIKMNETCGHPVTTQVSMVRTDNVSERDVRVFENTWIHRVDRVRIYEEHSTNGDFGSLKKGRKERKPCVMPFYEMLIYADGKIGRCNHDWDGNPVGHIGQKGIKEIWNNNVYHNLRQQHESMCITDAVCVSCDSWYPAEEVQGTGKVITK